MFHAAEQEERAVELLNRSLRKLLFSLSLSRGRGEVDAVLEFVSMG
jgi:hypothetical protein